MKLKPCPFCGGEAEIAVLMGTRYINANHKRNCIIKPDTWLQSTMPIKKQIKAWNRREPIDKVVEQLEEKVKEINDFCSVTYEGDIFVDARREALLEAIEIVKGGAV